MITSAIVEEKLPDPQLAAVREYWNEHVHDWKIARNPPGTREFFEEIEEYRFEKLHYLLKLIDYAGYRGQKVLDVGCGVANDSARFAKGGALVTGVDISPKAVAFSRENFAQRGLPGEFHVMNGEKLDLPDNSYDLVYCHTVMHFTPHPDRMARELYRVTKPGGKAIVMTVNRRSWLIGMHALMKIEIDHLDSPVIHRHTASQLKNFLHDFREVRVVPERFPVATKVHKGAKAFLYNSLFVGTFNALPKAIVRNTGHHLIAFCTK